MKKLILVLGLLVAGSFVFAQNQTAKGTNYRTAAGLKFWDGAGISVKTFIQKSSALEFVGFFNNVGTRITGLYEFYGALSSDESLKWYIGPGVHVGIYGSNTAVGIDGVIGADYKFKNLPLNISLDWQPAVELGSGDMNGFKANWGGLGVRYTF